MILINLQETGSMISLKASKLLEIEKHSSVHGCLIKVIICMQCQSRDISNQIPTISTKFNKLLPGGKGGKQQSLELSFYDHPS